ncbi:hypothetical protein CYLTODRAFT_487966 [Cylindrobasidium torrendii FP15055 ss-10]|uniref:Hydrophobin n=1 Tax=Cylindrobasidium torrendii FP15055 ss-10 TaxID=1314674 RepID=A0A0D7BKA9_9AGAR|nr:hypothetical protein CYLTODRAFT_487966 [Cylindrobasidium torrendii FP15055 ss-10]
MFARFSTLFVVSLAALSSASSLTDAFKGEAAVSDEAKSIQCQPLHTAQCCNKVVKASESRSASALLGMLGKVLDVFDVQVGITCTDLDQEPECLKGVLACCLDVVNDGVVSVGCHLDGEQD